MAVLTLNFQLQTWSWMNIRKGVCFALNGVKYHSTNDPIKGNFASSFEFHFDIMLSVTEKKLIEMWIKLSH